MFFVCFLIFNKSEDRFGEIVFYAAVPYCVSALARHIPETKSSKNLKMKRQMTTKMKMRMNMKNRRKIKRGRLG